MTNPTRTVRETRRFLRQTVKCLQHDATRKLIWIAQYAQKHPVLFILFGIIATPVLTPLVFAFLLMTPAFIVVFFILTVLGGISVIFFSVLSAFIFIFSLPIVAVITLCCISYRTTRKSASRVQKLTIYVATTPSRMLYRLRTTLYEVCSQLLEGISSDLGQRLHEGKSAKLVDEKHRDSDANELEDLEPDYRDRESKLYEALVQREWDTFEPFPY